MASFISQKLEVNSVKQSIPRAISLSLSVAVLIMVLFGVFPGVNEEIDQWQILIGQSMLFIGLINLTTVHAKRIRRREHEWYLSVLLFVFLYGMLAIGFVKGPTDSIYEWVFSATSVPLGATLMAILMFYIVSACYRAFRAKSFDAAVLLISGVLVLLGNAPIGEAIWPGFTRFSDWIFEVPNVAVTRAMGFGASAGVLLNAVRVMLGIERPYANIGG